MAVTELALLHLLPPTNATDASLLSHLRQAKSAMEASSGFPFHFFHCLEDPSLIFILGGWPSVQYHMEEWIPSKENQELLEVLKDEVEVEYMFHLDLDRKEREVPVGTVVMAFGRHFIRSGEKEGFERVFEEVKGKLEGFIGGKERVVGAWRVDWGYVNGEAPKGHEKEKEEWVLFTGWESKERHMEFAQTEEFMAYSRIRAFVEGADTKHGVKMEVA
jgi:heme-degrading monooxygenase HmoA